MSGYLSGNRGIDNFLKKTNISLLYKYFRLSKP